MDNLHDLFARWLTHWYLAIPVYGFGAYFALIGFFCWLWDVAVWLEKRTGAESEQED